MLIFLVRSIDALLLLYHPMIIFSYILLEFGAPKSIDPKYPLLYIAIVLICIYLLVDHWSHVSVTQTTKGHTRGKFIVICYGI